MADPNAAALMALFGGGITGSSTDDIANFRKTVAGNDYWRAAAQPVFGARFDTSTWSPGEALGVTAGQAFLGAVLNAIGQQQESQQLEKVAAVLPQLYKNPGAATVPEGVDPEAFAALKLSAMSRRDAASAAQNAELFKDLFGVKLAGMTAKEQAKGTVEGKQDAYGVSGANDPESPQYKTRGDQQKAIQDARDFLSKGSAIGQNYQNARSRFESMKSAIDDPSAAAALSIANDFLKIKDPTSVNREGEISAVSQLGPRLQSYLGELGRWFSADGSMLPETRYKLLELASNQMNSLGQDYQKLYDTESERLKFLNADPNQIAALRYEPFDYQSFAQTHGMGTTAGPGGVTPELYARLRAQGLTKEQIRERFAGQ